MSARPSWSWLWAALALVPALLCLVWTLTLSSPGPEPWYWRAHRGDPELLFSWNTIRHAPDWPGPILFRSVYLGLLSLPGADFGSTVWVSWLLAGATLLLSARWMTRGRSPGSSAAWLLPLSLWGFSPAFGADWLVASRLGIFVPVLCLAAAGSLLLPAGERRPRIGLAAGFALAAVAFHPTGVVVWVALVPLVLHAERSAGLARAGSRTALWCVAGNVASFALYRSPWTPIPSSRLGFFGYLSMHPGSSLAYLLARCADALPAFVHRTEGVPMLVGGILLVLFAIFAWALWLRRREEALLIRGLPGLACAAFGIGQAAVLTGRHLPAVHSDAVLRETSWGAWTLPVGLVALAFTLLPSPPRLAGRAAYALLCLLLLGDSWRGFEHLQGQSLLLRRSAGLLIFPEAAQERLPERVPPALRDRSVVQGLRQRGLLRALPPLSSLDASAFEPGAPFLSQGAAVMKGELDAAGARGRFDPQLRPVLLRPALLALCARDEQGNEELLRVIAPLYPNPNVRPKSPRNQEGDFTWETGPWPQASWPRGRTLLLYELEPTARTLTTLSGEFRVALPTLPEEPR